MAFSSSPRGGVGAMRLRAMHLMMVAAASSGAARALGCRFRGIVGAGRGGTLRTCAVPRGSLRLGGAALKFGLMSLVAPAATSNWGPHQTSRDAY